MKRQPFVPRLAMVCAPRRHGRRRLLCLGQTLMRCANVIDRAYQAHPLIQRQGIAGQRSSDPVAVRRDHTAPCIALDGLGEPDLAPRTQSGPSALARRQGMAPGLPHGPAV